MSLGFDQVSNDLGPLLKVSQTINSEETHRLVSSLSQRVK
jgi:hypothetical protein